jgi:hypothetical protein
MMTFKLWLEFEVVDFSTNYLLNNEITGNNTWDRQNDFCNIAVILADGRRYGINVWTFDYLATTVRADTEDGRNLAGAYQIPPDLFVRELTRECIEATITDLLQYGDLEKVLNPTIRYIS